jgi:two-component system response regulator FlrC
LDQIDSPSAPDFETRHDGPRHYGPLGRQLRAWLARMPHAGPVAEDPRTVELVALATRAAASDTTLLLTGPSGAGKEVMARHVHGCSPRSRRPFVAINCAALPDAMLEALLFGHVRGAFTGAAEAAPGLFRAADGGTLFLDELGELPLALQAKLLRAVETREVLPLGATSPVKVDVRLVAATHRDLAAAVAAGAFRADLYWRLSVFPLALPPLAERPADIIPLTAALLHRLGGKTIRIDEAALAQLQRHAWPGNVRELANVLERALILAGDGPISPVHLRLEAVPAAAGLAEAARRGESEAIRLALAETGGRKQAAARRLGISERTLRYKLAAAAGRPRTPARRPEGATLQ